MIIFLTAAVLLASCAKDTEEVADQPNYGKAKIPVKLRTLICDPSPINLPDGCGCFAPPVNCLSTVSIEPRYVSAFSGFNTAITSGTQRSFFSTNQYRKILPTLDDYPSFLNDLKNGNKLFVQVGAAKSNERIYALVDKSVQNSFGVSDVVLSFPFEM